MQRERVKDKINRVKEAEGREVPCSLSSVQWPLLIGCGFEAAAVAAVEPFSSFAVVWRFLRRFS